MSRYSDDRLVAYLDGEIDPAERRDIEAWLDSDPPARDKLAALAPSTALLRDAYLEVLHEPLPDRLIAAARGETAAQTGARILAFSPGRGAVHGGPRLRRRLALPVAASLLGFLVGGGSAYFGVVKLLPANSAGSAIRRELRAGHGSQVQLRSAP